MSDIQSHILTKFQDDYCWQIAELNDVLRKKLNRVLFNEFAQIILKGEIVNCKVFKNNCGIRFTIQDNESKFTCKAWASMIDIDKIKTYENTTCTVVGYIKQNNFYGFDFELEVSEDVINDNNDSKLKILKDECELKGYFTNKKQINWNTVLKIGVISKKDTQGYTDFMSQFKIPVTLTLKEIALEGEKTETDIHNAVQELQKDDVDVIIIIRGGGSTLDISNSFDRIGIFEILKKSIVPVITAIGHEADKDDKLLITNVSDYNYSTPTRAAVELNNLFIKPKINKLRQYSDKLTEKFDDNSEKDIEKEYLKLKCLTEKVFKNKFGGCICKVDDDEFVIIQKDDKFYKNTIVFTEPLDITRQDIKLKESIEEGIEDQNISIIKSNIFLLSNDVILNELITETIKKIENIEKQIEKFAEIKPQKLKSMYCRHYDVDDDKHDNKKISQLKRMYLWYIELLDNVINENAADIRNIYEFCEGL
jgi:exodeoxyribonuclease VII large subunit